MKEWIRHKKERSKQFLRVEKKNDEKYLIGMKEILIKTKDSVIKEIENKMEIGEDYNAKQKRKKWIKKKEKLMRKSKDSIDNKHKNK